MRVTTEADFTAMRNRLIARGLIGADHRLTTTGIAYVIELIDRLDGKRRARA